MVLIYRRVTCFLKTGNSTIDMKEKEVSNQYTLGFSKYIFGQKLKVQSDISYLTIADITDELLFRLQLEVHF
jgi:phosphate-selective porin OprO/OprP